MERYPLQEAEERELSLKSRLQQQDDSVPSLVIILERVISNKKVFSIFSFSVFFSLQFSTPSPSQREKWAKSLAGCPYFRSNHIAWVHESMHFLYIFGPQLWTLGAREIPMTFTGLCCDLDLWRSAEDVIAWFWFIFGSYWFYICLEDIQSLNESFLLIQLEHPQLTTLVVLNSYESQKMRPSQIQVLLYPQIWWAPRESVLFSALKEDDWDAKPMSVGIWRFDEEIFCTSSNVKIPIQKKSWVKIPNMSFLKVVKVFSVPRSSPRFLNLAQYVWRKGL